MITTIEEARAKVEGSTPHPGTTVEEWAAVLTPIVENRPPDRAGFATMRFESVLMADGSRLTRQVQEHRDGLPRFIYTGDEHADDSRWEYSIVEEKVVAGPSLDVESTPQPEWAAVAGRVGFVGPTVATTVKLASKVALEAGRAAVKARTPAAAAKAGKAVMADPGNRKPAKKAVKKPAKKVAKKAPARR